MTSHHVLPSGLGSSKVRLLRICHIVRSCCHVVVVAFFLIKKKLRRQYCDKVLEIALKKHFFLLKSDDKQRRLPGPAEIQIIFQHEKPEKSRISKRAM